MGKSKKVVKMEDLMFERCVCCTQTYGEIDEASGGSQHKALVLNGFLIRSINFWFDGIPRWQFEQQPLLGHYFMQPTRPAWDLTCGLFGPWALRAHSFGSPWLNLRHAGQS